MPGDSVESVREYAESLAKGLVGWYQAKSRWKRRMSLLLRVLSIVLITAGGMVPLIKATWAPGALASAQFDLGQLGYLLIGLGGAAIAFDRFFGFSSGWIRYITTQMAIERSIDEFNIEWVRLKLIGAPAEQFVELCKTRAIGVRSQAEQETTAWVLEFQSSLADLEKKLKAGAEEAKAPAAKAAHAG